MSNIELNQKIEALKAYAKSVDITYETISERSGIPVSTLKKIFSGKTSNPRLDTVQSIERALGIKESPASIDVFSDEERAVMEMYRSLPDKLKKLVYDQLVIYCEPKS